MNGIIGEDRFEVGKDYFDAIGRKWRVTQRFSVNGQPCLLVFHNNGAVLWGVRSRFHPAIVEDGGTTATVLLNGGFTTIYAEEEKE